MLTTFLQSLIVLIFSALTTSLRISITINMAINIVVLVLIFVYSDEILGTGWPRNVSYTLCGIPADWECEQRIKAVSAGVGILIG
jgi:hypothetical protein